jgi:AAA domain
LTKSGARSVRVLELEDLKPRGDLSDWIAVEGNTVERLMELASSVRADGVRATPAECPDPSSIPPRRWLYRPFYIRQFVSVIAGAGGVGKSVLAMTEALAMVTGKKLLGIEPAEKLKVWYWNGEDPLEELQRRFAAARKHYGLTKADIADRLFLDSGWTMPIIIGAQDRHRGIQINETTAKQIAATIRENGIDVMFIDPFITAHRVGENDNTEIEAVVNVLKGIAQETKCSILIVHHARKSGNGAGRERSVDDARGAGSLIAAARSVRVTNTMSTKEAEAVSIAERDRRSYFRSDHGKTNLSRPPEGADWFQLISVDLENNAADCFDGDEVGVVVQWHYPKVKSRHDRRQGQEHPRCGQGPRSVAPGLAIDQGSLGRPADSAGARRRPSAQAQQEDDLRPRSRLDPQGLARSGGAAGRQAQQARLRRRGLDPEVQAYGCPGLARDRGRRHRGPDLSP